MTTKAKTKAFPSGLGSRVFTTGQAAKLCGVSVGTMADWLDRGKLQGYRLPGKQDRRVPLESLVRFMREHGMSTAGLAGPLHVAVCTPLGDLREPLSAAILDAGASISWAASLFDLGLASALRLPDLVILDLALGRGDVLAVMGYFAQVVLVANEDEQGMDGLRATRALSVWRRPFDVRKLADEVLHLAGVS